MGEIAIYARQSIKKDASYSIDTQIKSCKEKASKLGYDPESANIYIDRGKSGGNTQRDEFQNLLNNVSTGKVEKVFVYRMDRLGRNLLDYLNYNKIFKENNCILISATEDFDSTDKAGKMITQLLMMFAEEERASIISRIKDTYYSSIEENGNWPGGPAPYGFVIGKIGKISTLVENPEEKPAVEFLFNSYANDLQTSLGMLGKRLYEKGYRSHKRDNGQFDNVTIARILRNTVYVKADKVLYNYLRGQGVKIISAPEKWDGTHAAHIVNKKPTKKNGKRYYSPNTEWVAYTTNYSGFIDSLTYIKVQERLATNKQIRRANTTSKLQEFAGKIKCGNCGYAIKIYNGEQLACYGRCGLHCCDAKFNSRDILIQELSLDDVRLYVSREIAEYYSILRFSYEKQKEDYIKLEEKREELEQQTARLVKSLTLFETETQQKPVADEIIAIGKEISDIDVKLAEFNSINTIELKENIDYYSLSIEKRKAIINKLIDKILIFDLSEKEKGNNRPYKIVVHWKKEINDEYKEMFKKYTKNISKEEKEKLFMEKIYAQPYEDYIKEQKEAKKIADKYKPKHWNN